MQTTVLRVKIYTPSGMPAVGAGVVARLTGVGVSLIDGYIDRSHVEVVTDAQGVAELTLWPSVVGTTGAEYRITARGSDGAKLLDELVTVPESSIEVWLHDIVMLPAPTPKPYDEASIALIQQNRIQAVDAATNAAEARDAAQAHAIEAAANIAAGQTLRIEAQTAALAAADAAGEAESARQAAELSSQTARQAESVATASAQEAAASATSAQATTQSALMLFGGLEAVQVAVDSTGNDAVAAAASRDAAEAASVAASSSATTAQISANNASAAASAVAADKLAVAADRGAVQGAASQVSADRAVVEAAALTATQAATTSLDRSAGLIAHAENLRGEVDADRVAAETARAGAEALFGDLAAIDEAVQLTYANRAIVDVALTNNLIVLASR